MLIFVAILGSVKYKAHAACTKAAEEYKATGYWVAWFTLNNPDMSERVDFDSVLSRAKMRMDTACKVKW